MSLKDIGLREAAGDGEARPSMEYVLTDRQRAEWFVCGDSVDSDQAVYLLVMRGHFTLQNARLAPRAPVPTGTTLTLTVDAMTGTVTDRGLGVEHSPLSALGPVTQIA